MTHFSVFLSVVIVLRNQMNQIGKILSDAEASVAGVVSDYELIVVDNASTDGSLAMLKELTSERGLPNLQVYALIKEVDTDTASWVGLENALGDFVVVLDPLVDDVAFVREMLEKAVCGSDVVFANNECKPPQSIAYRAGHAIFNGLYKWFNGIDLGRDAPQYRLLNKRVVNFILQHPQPFGHTMPERALPH